MNVLAGGVVLQVDAGVIHDVAPGQTKERAFMEKTVQQRPYRNSLPKSSACVHRIFVGNYESAVSFYFTLKYLNKKPSIHISNLILFNKILC